MRLAAVAIVGIREKQSVLTVCRRAIHSQAAWHCGQTSAASAYGVSHVLPPSWLMAIQRRTPIGARVLSASREAIITSPLASSTSRHSLPSGTTFGPRRQLAPMVVAVEDVRETVRAAGVVVLAVAGGNEYPPCLRTRA